MFGKFEPVISDEFRRCKFVFLANGSPTTQLKMLEQVPGAALVVADTMELWIQTAARRRAASCSSGSTAW